MKSRLQDFQFRNEYFPFLLPVFYFTHYYFVNYPFFPIKVVLTLLAEYLLVTVLSLILFLLLLKNWRKSSLFTFGLLFAQFFSIYAYDFLSNRIDRSILAKEAFLIAGVIIFAFLFLQLRKTSSPLPRFVKFLNVLMLSWIVIELFVFFGFKNYLNTELKNTLPTKQCANCKKPDVYLLILDEYAGQKSLTDKFQYDNHDFLSYLQSQNFHIVANSRSNYNVTLFSMASMLSLDKLKITNYEKPSMKDYVLTALKLNQSVVGQFFQQNGYEIYNLSMFSFTNLPSPFKHSYVRDLVGELKSRTFTDIILKTYEPLLSGSAGNSNPSNKNVDFHYNNALIDFFMDSSFKSTKPKFVYAHFLMPHFPHFLDDNGQVVDPKWQLSQDSYLSYLKYCNKKITAIINKILSCSATRPIILLMSDHGFRGFSKPASPEYYFMNLNAVYLPDHNYNAWYDGMSNVNQFRILLNQEFNQNFPLLKDTSIRLMGSRQQYHE